MTDEDFAERYAAALRRYLGDGGETSLAAGDDLGRRALQKQLSTMEIVEGHFRLVEESAAASHATALPFLLQTLSTFDIDSRATLGGNRRYQQQRARADDLEDRDAFHSALVNSLQEGFFVVDHEGTVIEVNEAFAAITGCGFDGLPYRWPYPWLVDETDAAHRLARLVREGSLESETPIRHRDGHVSWAAVSVNSVTEEGADRGAYVGTIRDVTTEHCSEVRRSAVVRLATALGVATSVTEVLDILLTVVASAIEVQRVVAVIWAPADSDPSVRVAGPPAVTAWGELDPRLREALSGARDWPPLTVDSVGTAAGPGAAGMSAGMMTVLSGADDAVLWFEYPNPG